MQTEIAKKSDKCFRTRKIRANKVSVNIKEIVRAPAKHSRFQVFEKYFTSDT